MKHVMYGTVSALALLLAVHDGAKADSTLTTSVTATDVNAAAAVLVDAANTIDDLAFFAASGAFQVQQNNSVNSVASQNAAIDAKAESFTVEVVAQANVGLSTGLNADNVAEAVAVTSLNLIDGAAFGGASGAFQVQQNHAINGTTGQNLGISAISDPFGLVEVGQLSDATEDNTTFGNVATATLVTSANLITGTAFSAASGAFQVQQNNSINSSAQQDMTIAAISAPGGLILVGQASDADLTSTVTGNLAAGAAVVATNTINAGAFLAAHGAFQVQQNNSINSAVSQNMAISAVSTH